MFECLIIILTWVLASATDSVFEEAAHAFLYLSMVALTLQQKRIQHQQQKRNHLLIVHTSHTHTYTKANS